MDQMNDIKSLMIDINPKEAIRLQNVVPLNSEYPKEKYYVRMVCTVNHMNQIKKMEIRSDEQLTFSGVKRHIKLTEFWCSVEIPSYPT